MHIKTLFKFTSSLLTAMIVTSITSCRFTNSLIESNHINTTLLYETSGSYIVGYEHREWVNDSVCPDPYSIGCRKISSTIYYPAVNSRKYVFSEYYEPALNNLINTVNIKSNKSIINSFKKKMLIPIKHNVKPAPGNFPVVIFVPGYDINANEYSYQLANLASNGYIVVAVNSPYISDLVRLKSKSIVIRRTAKWNQKAWDTAKSDIIFTVRNLPRLIDLSNADSSNINLLGHSMGGMIVVSLSHQFPELFNSAAAMDASYEPEWSDPHTEFTIPFMHIHASNWATHRQRKYPSFELSKNGSFVTLINSKRDINYTKHTNFTDYGIIQYIPEVKNYFGSEIDNKLGVGTADGLQVNKTIGRYVVSFFNAYAKRQRDVDIEKCVAKSEDSVIKCGPGTVLNDGRSASFYK